MIATGWQNLQYALRGLRRYPGFAVASILTLALGIGLNATLFTYVDKTALRPWPVNDPDSLVWVRARSLEGTTGFGLTEFEFLRSSTTSFSGLAATTWGGSPVTFTRGQPFGYLQTAYVSANFFDVTGIRTVVGRTMVAADDGPGAPPVALVSERWWRRQLGADPATIGRTLYVRDQPVTIVGVIAHRHALAGLSPIGYDLWLPMETLATISPGNLLLSPRQCCAFVLGRLRPEASVESANAELNVLTQQSYADAGRAAPGVVLEGTSRGLGRQRPVIAAMFVALGAVLLLVCANIGHLQFARALARRREMAVRLSLGATRWQLIRQLLTETLVLSLAGGALALYATRIGIPLLERRIFPDASMPVLLPDARVALFTLALCVLASLVTGLAPSRRATCTGVLLGGTDRPGFETRRQPWRSALLGTQVGLCSALLFAAGLVSRSISHALALDPGFAIQETAVARIQLPDGYDGEGMRTFSRNVLAALESASIGPVGTADVVPLEPSRLVIRVHRPGEPPAEARTIALRPLSPEAFGVLGIPLLAGRMAAARDEVVVNESFARTVPGGNALNQILIDRQRQMRVVGVVGDASLADIGSVEPMVHTRPAIAAVPSLLLRTPPGRTAAGIQAIVARMDPQAVVTITPLTAIASDSLAASRTGARIAWALAALALLVAAVGVFGVFASIVEERTREVGVRIALGARASQVIRMIVGSTATATLVGLAAGAALAAAGAIVLRASLYGLSPIDPMVFIGVMAILFATAIVATVIPARRATQIDPVVALRAE